MTPLEINLRARIIRDGPIPVSEYMAMAMADPDHGYYRKSDPLGAGGDFVTAPEISQVFGELIGLWCAVSWQQAGTPGTVSLVELGPGRGTLMADALRAAATVPAFTEACAIHLVETSPALRARQEQSLAGRNVTWHERLETVPPGPALFIANEFFDALPIDQFQLTAAGWRRRYVGIDPSDNHLRYETGDALDAEDAALPSEAAAAPVGSLFETCPAGRSIAETLGARVARDGVAALIIDYGHGHSGAGETLQAVRNHKYCNVLTDPGDADITAHVDFAALASHAKKSGAHPWGPIPQGDFLTALGIEARTTQLAANANSGEAELLRTGCQRLIGADSMGMLFKVMALTGDTFGIPAGFESLAGQAR